MANKTKILALGLTLAAAFVAGGWFFSALPRWTASRSEVGRLYQADGERVGIFDNIPPEDLAAAEAVASYSLGQEVVLPEDRAAAQERQNGADLPTQIALTPVADIAAIAPKEPSPEEETLPRKGAGVALDLKGGEVAVLPGQDLNALPEQESKVSMIAVPVGYVLIKNTADYKAFKTRARGSYPAADFNKQMVVVLESQSDFPDNVFEIDSARVVDGKLIVAYRVNVFGLDKKTNTHAAVLVDKTPAPLELKQVL